MVNWPEVPNEAARRRALGEQRRAAKAVKAQRMADLRAKQADEIKAELERTLTGRPLSWQARRAIRERVKAGLHPLKGTRICPW